MPTDSLFDIIRAIQQQAGASPQAEPKQAKPAKQPTLIGICIYCNRWMYNNPEDPFKIEVIAIPVSARASTFTFACISCAREKRLIN